MTNPNQELLDFAVENIEEWNYEFTHLRSDNSVTPLFYSTGDTWQKSSFDEDWIYDSDKDKFKGLDLDFKTSTRQVITKEEYLEAKGKQTLIRDKKYSVKLTGEQIAWILLISAKSCTSGGGVYGVFKTYRNKFPNPNLNYPDFTNSGVAWDTHLRGNIEGYISDCFKVAETEDQRKLRELKEQHAILGEKIKAMEAK